MDEQIAQLKAAGARVETSNDAAVHYVGRLVQALGQPPEQTTVEVRNPVNLVTLQQPLAGINVGLESFAESLVAQGAESIQVDWRPPAGGNEKLMAILERMKTG
jgi:FdrA protein